MFRTAALIGIEAIPKRHGLLHHRYFPIQCTRQTVIGYKHAGRTIAPYRCGRNRGSRAIHQYTGPTVMGAHRFDIIEIKKAFDDLHFAQQIVFFSL